MIASIKARYHQAPMLSLLALCILAGGMFYALTASGDTASDEQTQTPPAMPAEVVVIEPRPAQIWKEYSGRLEAVNAAVIRPQVTGRITDIRFRDGQQVREGDVLMVIDPRPFEATHQQAQAALKAAKNQLSLSRKEYHRAKELIKTEAISQRIYDERFNALKLAESAVQTAEAALTQAEIDLDYAYVKAPFDGRVSRAEITKGNLAEAGQNAPTLTTIVSDKDIYANFELDEQTYLSLPSNAVETQIPVQIAIPSQESGYEGVIYAFDNQIDPASGTVRARALFSNSDGRMLPGMAVTVRISTAGNDEKILLSERAIGTDQDRKFVYVLDEQNAATYREVKIGESVQGQRVILSGLSEGERVINKGTARIRPGMVIDPQITEPQQLASDMPVTTAIGTSQDVAEVTQLSPQQPSAEETQHSETVESLDDADILTHLEKH